MFNISSLTIVVLTTGADISLQSFRQRLYLRSDFHYLNVPRVGTITAYDDFDCAFKCLSNPMCFSVNLASSKGNQGKLWCELLSSDKYSNSEAYKGNMSSHHYSILVGYSLTWTNMYINPIQLGILSLFFKWFILIRIYFYESIKFTKFLKHLKTKLEAKILKRM